MSCVIGIADNGIVTMAGERGVSNGSTIQTISQPKIGIRGDILYGYVGTIGIGQVIEFIDVPPRKVDMDELVYLKTKIIPALRAGVDKYAHIPDDKDTSWLIGLNGRLFEINFEDWGVIEIIETAIGSGGELAMGALWATQGTMDSISRAGIAMQAAITYSPGCQGPIDVLTQ